jgi:hypothetical protein
MTIQNSTELQRFEICILDKIEYLSTANMCATPSHLIQSFPPKCTLICSIMINEHTIKWSMDHVGYPIRKTSLCGLMERFAHPLVQISTESYCNF